jgi:hypothetical protein
MKTYRQTLRRRVLAGWTYRFAFGSAKSGRKY